MGVLKTFTKFTGKHLCQNLLFNKVAGLRTATYQRRDSGTRYLKKQNKKLLSWTPSLLKSQACELSCGDDDDYGEQRLLFVRYG